MAFVMVLRVLLLAGLLLTGCASLSRPTHGISVSSEPEIPLKQKHQQVATTTSAELQPADYRGSLSALRLTARRTSERDQLGNRIWRLELHGEGELLVSWDAVSGNAQRQEVDRLWTPGNGSPLPPGQYSLGQPEPFEDDLWFDLLPRFATYRSALGIHRCYPGTGCICVPDRDAIESLAAWVRASGLDELTVLN